VAVVRKRTIPTERSPLVGDVNANFLRVEGVAWSAQRIPTAVNLGFLDRSHYFFIQVAPQSSSRGWVDPVPEPLLLRKSGRAANRTRDLWICSQKLWPLDHRGGPIIKTLDYVFNIRREPAFSYQPSHSTHRTFLPPSCLNSEHFRWNYNNKFRSCSDLEFKLLRQNSLRSKN
jgi:hypothetical protein